MQTAVSTSLSRSAISWRSASESRLAVAPVRRAPCMAPPRGLPRTAAQKQTFKSFDDMIENSDTPVLVDFYANWCGPCQMLAPLLGEVANALKGQIQVVKIDTEKYPNVASKHKIHALPTLVLFRNGRAVDRIEGLPTQQQLLDRLRYHLAGSSS